MKKLRHPHRLSLSMVAVAMALVFALPAGALAEAPGSTESSPPVEGSTPPPSPGWVPQGDEAEDTSDAAPPIRRGSSLGSGGSSKPSPSPAEEPAPTEEPAVAPAPSNSYEPQASSPSTFEEPASAPRPVPTVDPEPRPAPSAPVAVGALKPVAKAASPQNSTRPASPVEATPAADTSGPAAAGSGGLLWPALIVGLLILLYAGARLLLGPVEPDIFRSNPFRRVRRGYPRV